MFTPGENLLEWLTDKRGRDQFVLRCARCGCVLPCAALCCVVTRWDERWAGKPAGCSRPPAGLLVESRNGHVGLLNVSPLHPPCGALLLHVPPLPQTFRNPVFCFLLPAGTATSRRCAGTMRPSSRRRACTSARSGRVSAGPQGGGQTGWPGQVARAARRLLPAARGSGCGREIVPRDSMCRSLSKSHSDRLDLHVLGRPPAARGVCGVAPSGPLPGAPLRGCSSSTLPCPRLIFACRGVCGVVAPRQLPGHRAPARRGALGRQVVRPPAARGVSRL